MRHHFYGMLPMLVWLCSGHAQRDIMQHLPSTPPFPYTILYLNFSAEYDFVL
jgi:hypothetical protein